MITGLTEAAQNGRAMEAAAALATAKAGLVQELTDQLDDLLEGGTDAAAAAASSAEGVRLRLRLHRLRVENETTTAVGSGGGGASAPAGEADDAADLPALRGARELLRPGAAFTGQIRIPGLGQGEDSEDEMQADENAPPSDYTLEVVGRVTDGMGRNYLLAHHEAYGDKQACYIELTVDDPPAEGAAVAAEAEPPPRVALSYSDAETLCSGHITLPDAGGSLEGAAITGTVKQLAYGEDGFLLPSAVTHTFELTPSGTAVAVELRAALFLARQQLASALAAYLSFQEVDSPLDDPMHEEGSGIAALLAQEGGWPAWFRVATLMAEDCAAWLRHAASTLDSLSFGTAGEKAAVLGALTHDLWRSPPGRAADCPVAAAAGGEAVAESSEGGAAERGGGAAGGGGGDPQIGGDDQDYQDGSLNDEAREHMAAALEGREGQGQRGAEEQDDEVTAADDLSAADAVGPRAEAAPTARGGARAAAHSATDAAEGRIRHLWAGMLEHSGMSGNDLREREQVFRTLGQLQACQAHLAAGYERLDSALAAAEGRLPRSVITSWRWHPPAVDETEQEEQEESSCVICMTALEQGEAGVMLPCVFI